MNPPMPGAPKRRSVKVFVVLGIVFAVLVVASFAASTAWGEFESLPRTPFDDEMSLKIDLKAGVTYDIHEVVSGSASKTAMCLVTDPAGDSVVPNTVPHAVGLGSGEHDNKIGYHKASTSGTYTFMCAHDTGGHGSFYLTSSEDKSEVPVAFVAAAMFLFGPIATVMFIMALVARRKNQRSHQQFGPPPGQQFGPPPGPWGPQGAPR